MFSIIYYIYKYIIETQRRCFYFFFLKLLITKKYSYIYIYTRKLKKKKKKNKFFRFGTAAVFFRVHILDLHLDAPGRGRRVPKARVLPARVYARDP